MKKLFKRLITGALAFAIAYTAVPVNVHAEVLAAAGEAVQSAVGNSIGVGADEAGSKSFLEAFEAL